MASTLYSIDKACRALAGISSLVITDMTNVASYGPGSLPPAPGSAPSFTDNDLVYSIAFTRGTGVYSADSATFAGGDYSIHQVAVFVPLSRAVVDVLLRRMRNRPLMVIAIDRLGNQHLIYEARRTFRHSTGDAPGTRHGYLIQFQGPSHYLLPSIAGEGDIATAPPVGGVVPDVSGDCCISIQPTQIAYTPAPTGNASNLNELVTTPNGSVYFIDSAGRGLLINRPGPRYHREDLGETTTSYITLPMGYPLPDPADYAGPTYDEQAEISIRLWVKHGSRWLQYAHDEGFEIDYALGRITFTTDLPGGVVEVYSYEGIPARPI